MRNLCHTVLSANDDVSRTSSKIDANQLVSASFHAFFSDTDAAGTVKIQASNDPTVAGNIAADFTPTNWIDIPNATGTVTAGSAVLITIAQLSYRWLRVIFTKSNAGTGTITVNLNALGI